MERSVFLLHLVYNVGCPLTVLDHALLNIGPFACCRAPPGLLALSAILHPRTVRYYKSQQAPRLIGRGRRSSDATVNYITEYETAHHCFSAWNRDAVTSI
ncbi:hypothetical protein XENOCAPTIV_000820 [Xenoophorus captivus]|uniref:Secreted protein n=1 Tax=Xenoophorus captivus TaxID=1517983 RepID=A0ABV0RBH6_9TELE